MEVDADYEFNAPKYIDFLSCDPENEHVDSWFDENPDGHEGGIRYSQVPFDNQHSNFLAATKAISDALQQDIQQQDSAMQPEQGEQRQIDDERTPDPKPLELNSNQNDQEKCAVATECEENQRKEETINDTQPVDTVSKTEQDQMETTGEQKVEAEVATKTQTKRLTRSNSLRQKNNTPISNLKKRKSYTPNKQAHAESVIDTKQSSDAKKQKLDVKKPLITIPNTPSFLKRLKGKKDTVKRTSEAIEIERIKQLQKETRQNLKKNETFLQKALAPQAVHQPRVATELTKTVEFHFATDSRLKQHPMKTRSDDSQDGQKFVSQLRKHPPSPTFKNKKPTKPMPFKFTTDSKTSKADHDAPGRWKSVASAIIDFQTKTPDRWRSRPASQQNVGPLGCEKSKTKTQLTHPQTPQLMTRNRSRPADAPSKADEEDKVVQEMKSYKFKAKEVDQKMMSKNGMYGMPPLQMLPVTDTKPFQFQSDTRLEMRKKQEEKEEQIDGKTNKQLKKTATKQNTSVSLKNGNSKKHSLTEVKPFSFEERDKALKQKKQEKIQKVYEEEEKAREFHARPLPSLSPEQVITKPGRFVEAEPFNLATDERGAKRVDKWHEQMKMTYEQEKEKMKFKAQPCTVVRKEAFVPKPSSKPLVEISEFKLNTEERSKKREEFEFTKKEQQRMKEDEMQQVLKEKKEEEEKHLMMLRKQMVHKANPIRNYGELKVQQSDKPLTVPHTPKFETNKRIGVKVTRV